MRNWDCCRGKVPPPWDPYRDNQRARCGLWALKCPGLIQTHTCTYFGFLQLELLLFLFLKSDWQVQTSGNFYNESTLLLKFLHHKPFDHKLHSSQQIHYDPWQRRKKYTYIKSLLQEDLCSEPVAIAYINYKWLSRSINYLNCHLSQHWREKCMVNKQL